MPNILSLFSGAERSGGAPVDVFQFQRGASVWRYAAGRESQTVDGFTYTAAKVTLGAIDQKKDTPGIQVTVTLALELAVAQALLTDTGEPMAVTIKRVQSAGTPVIPVLLGDVMAVKFSGDTAELTIGTVERKFKTLIPRVRVQQTCPWALFSPQCGLNADDFDLATTISSVSGNVITVASVGSLTMTGGMIRLPSGRLLFVAKASGTDLTVPNTTLPSEAVATADVTLYPGCDKLFATCEGTFDNAEHFGGFPNLPIRNPSFTTLN